MFTAPVLFNTGVAMYAAGTWSTNDGKS